jgi:hypothetical protein
VALVVAAAAGLVQVTAVREAVAMAAAALVMVAAAVTVVDGLVPPARSRTPSDSIARYWVEQSTRTSPTNDSSGR